MMVTRCGCRRQAATTSAGPPHCWRPHQLYNIYIYDNDLRYILFIIIMIFQAYKAYVNTKINKCRTRTSRQNAIRTKCKDAINAKAKSEQND